MTEPLPPLSDDDLSALLDGEAGPDVAARVDADPAALARLDALRAAAAAVRTLPVAPLAGATVDDLIGRALAAADEAPARPVPTAEEPEAIVAPLRPRGGAAGVPRLLVAAAIVLLVAVGLGLVWSGRGGDNTETATDRVSQDQDRSGDGATAADQGTSENAEQEPAAALPEPPPGATEPAGEEDTTVSRQEAVTDLGEFASLDDLRTSLATSFPRDRSAVSDADAPTEAAVLRCQQLMVEVFVLDGEPTHIGQATVDGEPYLVYEFDAVSATDGTTPTTFLTINDPTSCDAERSFERTPG